MSNVHFTYKESIDRVNLQQGDILKKSDELVRLMQEVHPHYTKDSYTYFQVITQSCDLAKRSGRGCSAKYITLAAVKSLRTVIESHLDEISQDDLFSLDDTKYCSTAQKRKLKDLLNKLFNNNHKELFFLYADPAIGLTEDSCTVLHLSIAIKSDLHYQLCLDSKIAELDDNFKSKLGWAVGNLYSRVGTIDFPEGTSISNEQFDRMIEERLRDYVAWVGEDKFAIYKRSAKKFSTLAEIEEHADEAIKQKKERRLQQITNQISQVITVTDQEKTKIMNILASSPIGLKN